MDKTFFKSNNGTLSMIRLLAFMAVVLGSTVCLSGVVLAFFAFFRDDIEWMTPIIVMITTGGVEIVGGVIAKAWQKKSE